MNEQKAQQYAAALVHMVQKGATPHAAVQSLAHYLELRGMKNIYKRLPAFLSRLEAAHKGKNDVVLSVAQAHAGAHAKKEAQEHLASFGIEAHDVHVREDESLIGGWRLQGRGLVVDNSFKKHLLSFYEKLTH